MSAISLVFLLLLPGTAARGQSDSERSRGIGGRMQPGEVSVLNVAASKSGLRNFQMDSSYRNGRLLLSGFTADLGSGTVRAAGTVDWSNSPGPHRLKIDFENVEIASVLRVFDIVLDAQVLGMVSGTLDVSWSGLRGRLLRQSLSGTAVFRLGAGSVSGLDILNQVSTLTGIPELRSFQFDAGHATADIRRGTMFLTMPAAAGSLQRMAAKGTLNLPSEQIDVAGRLSLSRELARRSTYPAVRMTGGVIEGLNAGKKSDKFVDMPFIIRMAGNVEDPGFSIETLEPEYAQRTKSAQPDMRDAR